jgi:UDP-glucose 4-epimerase
MSPDDRPTDPKDLLPRPRTLPALGQGERVVVTGAAGNVGSRLCRTLLDAGFTVVGVDNFFSGLKANLAQFAARSGFALHQASVTEPGLLDRLSRSHGPLMAVLHMAAIVSVPWSMDHLEATMAVNHEATVALHAEARRLGIPAFVFAGSAAEYGRETPGPAAEEFAGEPKSPYGLAKYLSSRHIADSGYGASLRFFNLYGPSRGLPGPYDGVTRRFMAQAMAAKPLTIFGDGGQTRDFVHVDDAVRAVLLAAGLIGDAGPLQGVYNVGNGRPVTILELARLIRDVSGRNSAIVFSPERAGDLRHSLADVSRLRNARGFVPGIRFEDGIRATYAWFRENLPAPGTAPAGEEGNFEGNETARGAARGFAGGLASPC